jgi:Zn-dependent M28 family amino/carboxypeptidase
MDARERARMVLDINLDSVGGAENFTALTSGFAKLDAWVRAAAARAGLPLATHLPLMANSDHACFAAHRIPAIRLIAGFGRPDSHLRLLLTAADTRDKVQPRELDAALRIATALTSDAITASDETLRDFAS